MTVIKAVFNMYRKVTELEPNTVVTLISGLELRLDKDTMERIRSEGGYLISKINFSRPGPGQLNLEFERDMTKAFDSISLTVSGLDKDTSFVLAKCYYAMMNELGGDKTASIESLSSMVGVAEHYHIRENELNRIMEMSRQMIMGMNESLDSHYEQTIKRLREIDELRASILVDAEEEAKKQKEEQERTLEAERVALREKIDKEKAELELWDSSLKERESKMDDRDSKQARRDTVRKLHEELKVRFKDFGLTDKTNNMGRAIHWSCIIGMSMCVVLMVLYSPLIVDWPTQVSDSSGWALLSVLILKQSVPFFVFMALLSFYIRWNDRWRERHAVEEFRQKRLGLDIDRANWLVETSLEWMNETDREIPVELVRQLSANLFEQPDVRHGEGVSNGISAADLLGASNKLTVKTPTASIEIDRKGAQQLQKKATE